MGKNHKARLDMDGFGVDKSCPAIGALWSLRWPTVPLDKKFSFNQSHHHNQSQVTISTI